MKFLSVICFFLFSLTAFAQPSKLELGMKRNTAQTLMGKAKLETYKKDKSVYAFADSVFFTLEFDANDYCSGFFWSAKNETALEKILSENGFTKKDSITFSAPELKGLLKKEQQTTQHIYRFVAAIPQPEEQVKKPEKIAEEIPKEKPFYGFTLLGMKVWEQKENK
ncbi:MAG: hypothetical protein POELPBGB_01613 [Bacteroidia bacterium]|nr:hypothetical protein [Bacteroidia bacterium]